MSDSRSKILTRLRQAQQPFTDIAPTQERRLVQPMSDTSPTALLAHFTQQAEALDAQVCVAKNADAVFDYVRAVIGDDTHIGAWQRLPAADLLTRLQTEGITVTQDVAQVRVGMTGVDAAFAATGSIVLMASAEQARQVSLLPLVHIALIQQAQIMPHFEAWASQYSNDLSAFRQAGNINIITGASRTADIGMELVLGAHGPSTLHLVVMTD